jgi:hypothetical protein
LGVAAVAVAAVAVAVAAVAAAVGVSSGHSKAGALKHGPTLSGSVVTRVAAGPIMRGHESLEEFDKSVRWFYTRASLWSNMFSVVR